VFNHWSEVVPIVLLALPQSIVYQLTGKLMVLLSLSTFSASFFHHRPDLESIHFMFDHKGIPPAFVLDRKSTSKGFKIDVADYQLRNHLEDVSSVVEFRR
jgi:hypothetical protein